MYILSWNVNRLKNTKRLTNAKELANYILGIDESKDAGLDILVITEYLEKSNDRGNVGEEFIKLLTDRYDFKISKPSGDYGELEDFRGTVLIAAKKDSFSLEEDVSFKNGDMSVEERFKTGDFKWLVCKANSLKGKPSLKIFGVHMPNTHTKDEEKREKREKVWGCVKKFAADDREVDAIAIMIGDFNMYLDNEDITGTNTSGKYGKVELECRELIKTRWTDVWKSKKEQPKGGDRHTWISKSGRGFRLDYAFVPEKMEGRIKSAKHLDDTRTPDLSDHSALLIEIEDKKA